MEFDLIKAMQILEGIAVEDTVESETRKLTIRIGKQQEAFYSAVKCAMPPGASLSDAICLALELVMKDTRNSTALLALKEHSIYDIIKHHNVNAHEINTLFSLLEIKQQPLMNLGKKDVVVNNLSVTEQATLKHFFNISDAYFSAKSVFPYQIRELTSIEDAHRLKESKYKQFQPMEALLLANSATSEFQETIIIKKTEYALNLSKTIDVFQPIGRLVLESDNGAAVLQAFTKQAAVLKMRSFHYCVDAYEFNQIHKGAFFHSPGKRLNGRITVVS